MSPLERSGSKPRLRREVESQIRNQKDLERFGSTLWRGPALEVVESTIIHNDVTRTSFILESKHLPFGGDIPPSVLSQLSIHMRSRYALVGLDVPVQNIFKLYKGARIPENRESVAIELPIINHCARPVELPKGAKPFHFFLVPPTAYIQGEELEAMIGNEEEKAVCIQGYEEKNWKMDYKTSPTGERLATGFYLKIDPEERFWIPHSDAPLRLTEEGSFREVREHLFENVFRKTDDPDYPMPEGALWIGKGPFMRLAHNLYVKLDHDAYAETNGSYEKIGMQTHSPLLEGGRTNHFPHVEIIGPANWVRATVIRNGETAKPG